MKILFTLRQMFLILFFIIGLLKQFQVKSVPLTPYNMPGENRTLIVLSVPSVWDVNYYDDFVDIISFQIEFARILHEHENVIFIADRHTMPYLDGRISLLKTHFSSDAIVEDNIYDINIHDFAPQGVKRFIKFIYRNPKWTDMESKKVDDSMNHFLVKNRIRLDKREMDIVLSGRDVVDNGKNKAIISDTVIERNNKTLPEWAMLIKFYNIFKKVLMVPSPKPQYNLRLDDIMAFVDDNILIVSSLDEYQTYERLQAELIKKSRNDIMLVDLPGKRYSNEEGNCGIYSAILATDKYIYAPVFGNSPSHWQYGYSSMMDKMVLKMIETNTHKKVIPITIPRAICRRGLSLRSMAWTVHGHAADTILNVARMKFAAV